MTDKMELLKISVAITEGPDRWILQWEDCPHCWTHKPPEHYWSAAEAQKSVREFSETLAEVGISTIVTIDWAPTTSIGRSVVKVLSEPEQKERR